MEPVLKRVVQMMIEHPTKIKSIHLDDVAYDFRNIKNVDLSSVKSVYVNGKGLRFINDEDVALFDQITDLIRKTTTFNQDKKLPSLLQDTKYQVTVQKKNGNRKTIHFNITAHAVKRFVERALNVIYSNDVDMKEDIGKKKFNELLSYKSILLKSYDTKSYIGNIEVENIIFNMMKHSSYKSDPQLGNVRDQKQYKKRETRHGQSHKLSYNPFLFIVDADGAVLRTVELFSSSFKYRKYNTDNSRLISYIRRKIKNDLNNERSQTKKSGLRIVKKKEQRKNDSDNL